ncbi:MAG: hypothetical protein UHP11_06825, partial [Anaerovoracaceae bacterium]|nr:hypothetical protein [Anaerovoracaceae bacterium]
YVRYWVELEGEREKLCPKKYIWKTAPKARIKKGMYVKYVKYWADLEGGLEDTFYRCDNGMCKGALVL